MYILLYLLLLALVPNETVISNNYFFYYLLSYLRKCRDAFVVLYELIEVLQILYVFANYVIHVIDDSNGIYHRMESHHHSIRSSDFICEHKVLILALALALVFDVCTRIYHQSPYKSCRTYCSSILSAIACCRTYIHFNLFRSRIYPTK